LSGLMFQFGLSFSYLEDVHPPSPLPNIAFAPFFSFHMSPCLFWLLAFIVFPEPTAEQERPFRSCQILFFLLPFVASVAVSSLYIFLSVGFGLEESALAISLWWSSYLLSVSPRRDCFVSSARSNNFFPSLLILISFLIASLFATIALLADLSSQFPTAPPDDLDRLPIFSPHIVTRSLRFLPLFLLL